jgi:thymidylate kinase
MVTFFERLNQAGVRYGVFKSSRNTLLALDGDQDLDILVARDDYKRFCAIASGCAGIRSTNHRSLASAGREDWFIPDFERANYLHLDVHTCVRLGGKFNKRYAWFAYEHIAQWRAVPFGGCSIPVVSHLDEAAITLARIAFRQKGMLFGAWQRLTGDWSQEIDDLLFEGADAAEKQVAQERIGLAFCCLIRKHDNAIWVRRSDLAHIRRSVRAHGAAAVHSVFTDAITNAVRTWHYAASRFVNRMAPGFTMDRRRPSNGGLIVAVVAPDGLGKTTQVEKLSRLFGWKFCCTSLYLGTGDGRGWLTRRLIRSLYIRRRSKVREALQDDPSATAAPPTLKSRLAASLLAIWGLLTALERHACVRRARRMADRGFIVFCDRWPQSIQPGLMDGPTRSLRRPSGLIRKWELSLYDRMSRTQPDVLIHLTAAYEVSQARKPGEITREEFEKRLSLMKHLRTREPGIYVVDAAEDIDEVSRSLFRLVWNAL